MQIVYGIVGILAGASIVVSRMVNASLASRTGVYPSTFYNYLTGLVLSAILLPLGGAITGGGLPTGPSGLLALFGGGLFGVSVVVISNIVTHRLQAFVMTLLVFVSQLFVGILLDYRMLGTFSAGRAVGGVLLLAGLYLYQNPPKAGHNEQNAAK